MSAVVVGVNRDVEFEEDVYVDEDGNEYDNLTNYYYGVSEAEARPDRPAYLPGESQWLSFGLNTSWRMSDRIVFFGNVGFGGTDSEVRAILRRPRICHPVLSHPCRIRIWWCLWQRSGD